MHRSAASRLGSFWLAAAAVICLPAAARAGGTKWAVVNSAGTLVRGSGATGALHLGAGTYEVDFATSMVNCAYVATSGDVGVGAVSGPIEVTVASRAGVPKGLFIQTFDQTTGATVDAPFHVITYCGTSPDYAVVGSDGVLARGSGVVSATRLGIGNYEVVFDRTVKKCTFSAAIGTIAAGSVPAPGEITVAVRAGNGKGVFVRTIARTGGNADSPFHLGVDCGDVKLIGVINADGTKARGTRIVSSTRLSSPNAGLYEAIFDRNVTSCAYIATIGLPGSNSIGDPVTITTASRSGNVNGVFLFIHHQNGATLDEPFHLAVWCP
jgi:hypothetical protein